MSLRYIESSDSDRRGSLYHEFRMPLDRQLEAVKVWIGHAERHVASGDFGMAREAFSQIEDAADVVHTRLTDLAKLQRLQRQVVREPDPPDVFGGPSCDTRGRDLADMDASEGFGYMPGEDARPRRMRRRSGGRTNV